MSGLYVCHFYLHTDSLTVRPETLASAQAKSLSKSTIADEFEKLIIAQELNNNLINAPFNFNSSVYVCICHHLYIVDDYVTNEIIILVSEPLQ